MSGIAKVNWQESAAELYARYIAERDITRRKRLQALWLECQGRDEGTASRATGGGRRSLRRWLGWYRTGGLDAVLGRVPGHGARGVESRLTVAQREELLARVARGEFRTYDEARAWVERQWGWRTATRGCMPCSHRSMSIRRCRAPGRRGRTSRHRRHGKRGLTHALLTAGITVGTAGWHADEMRLGLRGQTRRVLAPRGVNVVQRMQPRYEWRYLLLGVDPVRGLLRWRWPERLRREQLLPALIAWGLPVLVWDGAGTHRGKQLATAATKRVFLPPYSPELNPAERVFEEIRRRVEGVGYPTIAEKQAAVERYLTELAADPARVKRLCGWGWLTDALAALPNG